MTKRLEEYKALLAAIRTHYVSPRETRYRGALERIARLRYDLATDSIPGIAQHMAREALKEQK